MERRIRPPQKQWPDPAQAPAAMIRWEQANGITLPDDYRAFMQRYDGGRVCPLIFNYTIPRDRYPTSDPVPASYLDPLYDWAMVENIWNGGIFSRRNPPSMLVIGQSRRNGDPAQRSGGHVRPHLHVAAHPEPVGRSAE
jgi:hypothetical protein